MSQGTLLGGRVSFAQPECGYRTAIDPVLLAASAPTTGIRSVVDLGCGVGAAMLCFATRAPEAMLVGVEIDDETAAIARTNIVANKLDRRASIVLGDLTRGALRGQAPFDLVFANPPHHDAARSDPSPHQRKRRAHVEDDLGAWIDAAARLLKPRGWLAMVHRADRLDDLLAALGRRFGAIEILPLWPRHGVAAKRLILRARLGARTPIALMPGVVLHEADGRFTPPVEATLRDGAALWPSPP
jgi:tRNA1(Val) A37 N6-methylase TrmN6